LRKSTTPPKRSMIGRRRWYAPGSKDGGAGIEPAPYREVPHEVDGPFVTDRLALKCEGYRVEWDSNPLTGEPSRYAECVVLKHNGSGARLCVPKTLT
jgi:hypothetical protein